MKSRIEEVIKKKKIEKGEYLADVIIDLCFVTSYKIEDLLEMPKKRLERLIERFVEIYGKKPEVKIGGRNGKQLF